MFYIINIFTDTAAISRMLLEIIFIELAEAKDYNKDRTLIIMNDETFIKTNLIWNIFQF